MRVWRVFEAIFNIIFSLFFPNIFEGFSPSLRRSLDHNVYSIYRSGVDPVHYIQNRILKCALIWIRIRASFKNLKKIYKNIGMWKKFWIRPIGVESFFLLLTLWIRISFWIVDPIGMRINNTAFSAPSFLDVNKSSFYYWSWLNYLCLLVNGRVVVRAAVNIKKGGEQLFHY